MQYAQRYCIQHQCSGYAGAMSHQLISKKMAHSCCNIYERLMKLKYLQIIGFSTWIVYGIIFYPDHCNTAANEAEHQPMNQSAFTKDLRYLTRMCELWGVFCEEFEDVISWPWHRDSTISLFKCLFTSGTKWPSDIHITGLFVMEIHGRGWLVPRTKGQ